MLAPREKLGIHDGGMRARYLFSSIGVHNLHDASFPEEVSMVKRPFAILGLQQRDLIQRYSIDLACSMLGCDVKE